MYILLDLSISMNDKDMRPTRWVLHYFFFFTLCLFLLADIQDSTSWPGVGVCRWDLTLQYLRGFVMEWFDQNPLGQVRQAVISRSSFWNLADQLALLIDRYYRTAERVGRDDHRDGRRVIFG